MTFATILICYSPWQRHVYIFVTKALVLQPSLVSSVVNSAVGLWLLISLLFCLAGSSFCFNEFSPLSSSREQTQSLVGSLPWQSSSCFIKSMQSYQEEKKYICCWSWLKIEKFHVQEKETREMWRPLTARSPLCWFKNGILLGRLCGSVSWASDFGSGHDLMVCEFEPCVRLCADGGEPAQDSLFPPLSGAPPLVLSLSLSK